MPPHDRKVALLAQEPLLFPHLGVLDNVAFGPRSGGARRRTAHEAARRWLDEVDVADLADRKPGQLSGGQAQRVAVARALAAEPRLLLLDEPLAALDVAVAPALRQTLRRVLADRTVVLVTHDVLDALLLADRVVVLEGGRVVESGPTHRRAGPAAERVRGPDRRAQHGRRHLARRRRRRRRRRSQVQGLATDPVPVAGDPVVAVFRPSAVSVFREAAGRQPAQQPAGHRDRPGADAATRCGCAPTTWRPT